MTTKPNITVYELEICIALLQDISATNGLAEIAKFIDKTFIGTPYAEMHQAKEYKPYTYSNLHPINKDGVYQRGNTYTFRIRTLNQDLAIHFVQTLQANRNAKIQGLLGRYWKVTQHPIEAIYSITPAVIKTENGYWKTANMTLDEYITRLKVNAWKKYSYFTGIEANEAQELFTGVTFTNRTPVVTKYKDISILGDKLQLTIATNEQAQNIAYMLLATGILENGARGLGYCNPKWIR